MTIRKVESYMLFCEMHTEIGYIKLIFSDGDLNLKVSVNTFTAYVQMLQHDKPVYFDTDKKALQTGEEPVGIPED